jgi:hypothetical protein
MRNRRITKKIYISILSFLLLTSCGNKLSGQDIVDKLTKELCKCFELAEYKNSSETGPCYDELFKKNEKIIREYYKTNELSESQIYEFGNKIAAKSVDNCDYIKNNFPTGIVGEKRAKQLNVKCEDLKNGEYYYLTQRPNSDIQDTTFVTISNDKYLEKMRNKTTYSQSKIIWKNDCKYDLMFEESDDPFRKELLKNGDLFSYEVIANENESFFAEINHKGRVYQYQIFKIK